MSPSRSHAAKLSRRSALRAGLSSLALGVLPGCGSTPSLVPIGGQRVDASEIDRDPLALLPGGIVVFGNLDLAALYQTPLGGDVVTLVQGLVPLGAETGFVPARDTSRVVGGVYAMQGVDFCAVVQGRFDVAAIQRAADARLNVPSGLPLVKTRYGEFDLYTVGNVGFVLLTASTLVSGNETGMRRALDRLRFGKLGRQVPPWMVSLAETKGASFALAGDFGADSVVTAAPDGTPVAEPKPSGSPAEPVLEASATTFPFLSGLRALRVLGNFNPPGLNFAGSLTYATVEKAGAGAASLRGLSDMSQWINLLAAFGFGASLPPAQIAVQGSDVAFVQPVDTQIARSVIGLMSGFMRRG